MKIIFLTLAILLMIVGLALLAVEQGGSDRSPYRQRNASRPRPGGAHKRRIIENWSN